MSKYLVYGESHDGASGTLVLDTDEELERFKKTVADDARTRRYAVVEMKDLEFVELPARDLETEFALARARQAELQDMLARDPSAMDDLPVQEIAGFKVVNASGEDLPDDLAEALMEALLQTGQVRVDDEGKIVPVEGSTSEGELMGVDIRLDDAGELVHAEKIDVRTKKQLN